METGEKTDIVQGFEAESIDPSKPWKIEGSCPNPFREGALYSRSMIMIGHIHDINMTIPDRSLGEAVDIFEAIFEGILNASMSRASRQGWVACSEGEAAKIADDDFQRAERFFKTSDFALARRFLFRFCLRAKEGWPSGRPRKAAQSRWSG